MSIRNYEMNLNQDSDQEDELFDENCIEIIRDDVNFQQEGSDVSDEDYINETNEDDNCDDDGFLEQQKVLNEIVFLDDSIQEPVYSLDIHPLIKTLVATGGGDDNAFLWQITTGESLVPLAKHSDSCISVKFSVNGVYLATGGMDGNVFVYKSINGEPVVCLDGPDEIIWMDWHPLASVNCGAFTPSGKNIVSGGEDGAILVWDPKTASILQKFTPLLDSRFHSEPINTLAINKESQLILSGSQDGSARLLHLTSGKILAHFNQHEDSVEAVTFCAKLNMAITSDTSGTINLWDINSFHLRSTLKHDDAITKLLVQDERLYSSSADKTIKVWDLRSGLMVKVWKGHQDCILDFCLWDNGVVSCSDDGNCLVFSFDV